MFKIFDWRRVSILWALVMSVVVLSGSAYDRGRYSTTGSYQGSTMRAAGWDTVVLLFAINTDTTDITHSNSEFNYWRAQAGDDGSIDLSDLENDFAFCVIDTQNAYVPAQSAFPDFRYDMWMEGATTTGDRWKVNDEYRQHVLFYIPFERFIPANSQIIFADIKVHISGAWFFDENDSLCVTLMTNPGDSLWYRSRGLSNGVTTYAHANWRWQQAGHGARYFYPDIDAGPWGPPDWNRREFPWDIGDYSDWTGYATTDAAPEFVGCDLFNVDMTDCVQAAVNGAVNNGFCIQYMDRHGAPYHDAVRFWSFHQSNAYGDNDFSYFVVKYITRPYMAPLPNGQDFAVCFQTDDGKRKINEGMAAVLEPVGGKFSIGTTAHHIVVDGNPEVCHVDSIIAWHDRGLVELASHTVNHTKFESIGDSMAIGEYTRGMYPDTLTAAATQWDRMLYECDPEWTSYLAEQKGRPDLADSPYWGKSLFQAVGPYSAAAQKALAYHDYSGFRCLAVDKTVYDSDGDKEFRTVAGLNPANADTAYGVFRHNLPLDARNMMYIANTHGTQDIVGLKTDDFLEAAVKLRTKSIIENIRAQDRGVFSFFAHDVKTDPDGAYLDGLDMDEFGWIVEVIEEYPDPYLFFSDLPVWLKQWGTPTQTPSAYALDDSFKFRADDAVWYLPDGMEGRFIRGLKRAHEVPPDYPDLEDVVGEQYKANDVSWPPNSRFALGDAIPNPFNPVTTIIYELPKESRVKLTIYDLQGRLVKVLVGGAVQGPGRYDAVWRGRDGSGRKVAAGVYFYRLETGSFKKTQRMTLIK